MIQAFGRCDIKRAQLTTEHLTDGAMCANLLQVDWANRAGVNAWTVELMSTPLVQGTSTYNVDPATTMIMAAYIESGSPAVDRLIYSIGRDEYAAYPDKVTQGAPIVYWFDRLIQPTITVWQPPDGNGPYTLKYYRARQTQDATLSSATQPEVPYRFLLAYMYGLAAMLAETYAPAKQQALQAAYEAAFARASQRDGEDVQIYITPMLGAYTNGIY